MSLHIERAEAPPAAVQLRHEPRHEPLGNGQTAESQRSPRRVKPKTVRDGFVVCLVLITLTAVYGQIGYGITHYTPGVLLDYLPEGTAHLVARLVVAVAIAIAIESIANVVQYQARVAHLAGDTAGAAKLSRVAYGIAAGVAFINYQHFCDPGLRPNPTALMFAALSFFSPWLWALYTRAAERSQRVADGTFDKAGAIFAVERYRSFPIHTWRARRYSIMHNLNDPVEAWNAYMADYRVGLRQRREDHRTSGLLMRLLMRQGGVKPGAVGGATGGAKTSPQGGATGGVVGGAKGGATPVVRTGDSTPAGAEHTSTVTSLHGTAFERAKAEHSRVTLSRDEQAKLRGLATDWAATQGRSANGGQVPSYRPIFQARDDRGRLRFLGLTEYSAKEAADAAKARVQGRAAQ
jgi:hypothetical protein